MTGLRLPPFRWAGIICLAFLGLAFFPLEILNAQDAPDTQSSDTANEPDAVSFQTFYDSLANEGSWIQTNDYGYVWQPSVNDPEWAPYTDGHWVYTEDGWTWVSDESWGWATYHYGRWVNLDGTGWCWVPGYTWGPAWVSWRYGDGYCGWAPLPPDSLIGTDYASGNGDFGDGFHIGGDCDSYYGIGAGWYNFLPVAYLGDSNYRGYYVNRYNNYRLINRTTNVTNINLNRTGGRGSFDRVNVGGPSLLQVNARSQTAVPRLHLGFTQRTGGGEINGDSLAIFAPRVDTSNLQTARPSSLGRTVGHTSVNRGTDISRPLLVRSQLSGVAPTSGQIRQGQLAQAMAPTSARVATAHMTVHSGTATPFTSMRPINPYSERRSYPSAGGRSYQAYPGDTRPSFNTRSYQSGGSYGSGGVYVRPSSNAGAYQRSGTGGGQGESNAGAVRHR